MADNNANNDDTNTSVPKPASPAKTAWRENRPLKKDASFYVEQRKKFDESFKGNEFLTIPEALDAVSRAQDTCGLPMLKRGN